MKEKLQLSIMCLLITIMGTTSLYSQETAHYVPGIAGIKAGTPPPPGFYYVMHNVFYNAGNTYDGDGNKTNLDFDLNVFSNVHRFVYVKKDVLWGADYVMNAIIPLVNTNISIGDFGIDAHTFALGDVVLEPIALSWRKPKYELTVGLAAIAPLGKFDVEDPAAPGKGYWTGMLTIGATYYFDKDRTWTVSMLNRLEMHSKKEDFDITAGNDYTFEYGIGKTILGKKIWSFGVAGYAHWQLSEDKGDDVIYDPNVKDQVFSVGPEVDLLIPQIMLSFELRGLYEFRAIDRPQGTTVCLSLIKGF